jgi:hypothetical protein
MRPLLVLSGLVALTSCIRGTPVPKHDATETEIGSHEVRPCRIPPASEKMPMTTSDKSICDNVLPDGWDAESSGYNVELLYRRLIEIQKMQQEDEKVRKVRDNCEGANEINAFTVRYSAPAAMKHLPRIGTRQRSVVAATFMARADRSCPEQVYGVENSMQGDQQGFRREIQFLAIQTTALSGDPDVDTEIGRWRSYRILTKQRFASVEYKLVALESSGPYVVCGTRHTDLRTTVAFLGCKTLRRLAAQHLAARDKIADSTERSLFTLSEVVAAYKARDQVYFSQYQLNLLPGGLTAERMPTDDGAWVRCGDLGCCSAEGT